jgi:uncharacterized membrane protein
MEDFKMAEKVRQGGLTDEKVETILGNLLRTGVVVSAVVVALGAMVYLFRHGLELPDYKSFKGEPADLKSVGGIVRDVLDSKGRGIIQFGLLLLVATPVMRVLLSVIVFMKQYDKKYVAITLIVSFLLIYSLFGF